MMVPRRPVALPCLRSCRILTAKQVLETLAGSASVLPARLQGASSFPLAAWSCPMAPCARSSLATRTPLAPE